MTITDYERRIACLQSVLEYIATNQFTEAGARSAARQAIDNDRYFVEECRKKSGDD